MAVAVAGLQLVVVAGPVLQVVAGPLVARLETAILGMFVMNGCSYYILIGKKRLAYW